MRDGATRFEFRVRVYYEDTDTGGIVFYANYLKYFERARTEWLRNGRVDVGSGEAAAPAASAVPGVSQQRVADELGLMFVVRSTTVDYKRPALLDDSIRIVSTVERLGRVGIDFHQEAFVSRSAAEGERLLAVGRIKVGCVSRDGLRPMPIPEPIRLIFADA